VGALALAWITGQGIIVWQSVAREHHPPIPGRLLGSSAVFGVLAVIAEFGPQSARAAALAAWAFDLAALLQVLPEGIGVAKAAPKKSAGPQNAGAAPTQTGA
jgi:hypothetical protein